MITERSRLESILEEQLRGWEAGDRPMVEDILARNPWLRDEAEAVLDVIYQEFLIRLRLGEAPRAEEFLLRFPAWSDALSRQFAVDEAMRSVDESTAGPLDESATIGGSDPLRGARGPAWPRTIDGYDILGELGRGGMGVVYKALDRRLNRIVAIKTIGEAMLSSPSHVRRFLAEAELIARLRHPHIIPIHAVGEQQGWPYFSLEFAEGGSLSHRLAQGPVSTRQAAELVETLAWAVHAAHQAGIIHRDLKPSNVLLAADGTPKIGDFGLAKLLGDDSARTLSGEVVGTPSYMAPEQAEGSRDVGPAVDIYAMGAILYQSLTGRPPFLGASAMETLKLVVSTEVVPPTRQRPDVPRDLETIALKCLEKDPRRRYPDAAALADDLRRFLDGRPIAARPVGRVGRLWRWSLRNPALAATAAALTLTFALGSPALLTLWLRARGDRARAEVERDRAERSRDRAISAVQDLLQTEGDDLRSEELRPYRKAMVDAGLRQSMALIRDLEGNPRAELQQVKAYLALSQLQAEAGEGAAAAEAVRKAISLAEGRLARAPDDAMSRWALGRSLHRAAVILADHGERLAAAQRSIDLLRTVPPGAAGPGEAEPLLMIAMTEFNRAVVLPNRRPEAIDDAMAARAACRQLIDQGRGDSGAPSIEARALLLLCRLHGHDAHWDRALAAGEQAESICVALSRDHPDSFDQAWQLVLSREEIAMIYEGAGRIRDAIRLHESARRTLQEMAERHGKLVSRMVSIQAMLGEVDFNLAEHYDSEPPRYAAARRTVDGEAYTICQRFASLLPLNANLHFVQARATFARARDQAEDGRPVDIELLFESARACDGILARNPGAPWARAHLVVVRRRLAEELAARGRMAEASEMSRRSLETARGDPEMLYSLAARYARSVRFAGTYPTGLGEEQLGRRRRHDAEESVAMLRQAEADGFRDAHRLSGDPDFATVRADRAFAAILDDLDFPADPFSSR